VAQIENPINEINKGGKVVTDSVKLTGKRTKINNGWE